jgi:hypothetical protein
VTAEPDVAQAHVLFETLPDGRFLPTEFSRGPWSPDALHGGPVAALVTGAAEGHEVDRSNPMQVARLTLELLRPVPLEPLTLSLRTTRRGRKVQLIEVGISAGVREVARALVLRARQLPLDLPPLPADGSTATGGAAPVPVPGPQDARRQERDQLWTAFHNSAMDVRYAAGGWLSSGPATVWFRLTCPVVEGWPVTPAMRAAAAADFGNGISMLLPFEQWSFVNPDLTMYLDRAPVGEWVCLDATTTVRAETGLGLAQSALFDERGAIGRAMQTLVIEPR